MQRLHVFVHYLSTICPLFQTPTKQIFVAHLLHMSNVITFWKCKVKWSEVQCREGKGVKTRLYGKSLWVVKWWEVKGWGEKVSTVCVGRNTGNCIQYFLTVGLFTFCTRCILSCLVCIVVSCLVVSCVVCIFVILCVFAVLCVYCCFYFRCRTAG